MIGIPMFVHKTCYVPYSQAKVGGTVRQLGSILYERNVYYSTQNLSVQMAGTDVKAYCVSGPMLKSDGSAASRMFHQSR